MFEPAKPFNMHIENNYYVFGFINIADTFISMPVLHMHELMFCSFSLVTQSSYSHALRSPHSTARLSGEKSLRKIGFQFNLKIINWFCRAP